MEIPLYDETGEEMRAKCEVLQLEMSIKKMQTAYPQWMSCCINCTRKCMQSDEDLYKDYYRKKYGRGGRKWT